MIDGPAACRMTRHRADQAARWRVGGRHGALGTLVSSAHATTLPLALGRALAEPNWSGVVDAADSAAAVATGGSVAGPVRLRRSAAPALQALNAGDSRTYRPCNMPPLPRPNASAASRLTVHSLWRDVVGWAPLFHDMGRGLEDKGSTHVGKFTEDADSVGHALDARPAHRPPD